MTGNTGNNLLPRSTGGDGNQESRPSLTYGLDEKRGRIAGRVDGVAAVAQSIRKRLLTEANVFPVYGSDYGFAFFDLVGLDAAVIESEVARRLEEALLRDERIEAAEGFAFRRDGDGLRVAFSVTCAGGVSTELEGRINGL